MALQQLDHYEILTRLGDGFVYKARDSKSGEVVAIKVLPAFMRLNEGLRARFEREVRVERSIEHPNLARFLDVGETEVDAPELVGSAGDAQGRARVLYLVREYVEGANLQSIVGGKLPVNEAVSTAKQIAEALTRVHASGLVHRNINPANIRITPSGAVKLLDFGLVKLLRDEAQQEYKTSAGQLIGTAPYLAPEQVKGEDVDARTDLFALGVLLYHMVAGQPPFPKTNLLKYFHSICEEEPQPLSELRDDLPDELVGLIGRLLAKAPADRYPSANHVAADLAALMAE